VVERGREPRLALEAFPESLAVGELLADHLQRDGSSQRDLRGAVDHAHASSADLVFDPEVTQDRARR
jgi:hypothetical protein